MTKLVGVLALAFSSVAFAQTGELWFNFGESLLKDNGIGTTQSFGGSADDVQLNSDWRFSFRFGFNQGNHFGHEIQYAYNRTQLQFNLASPVVKDGMAFHQGGFNFLYYLLTTDKAKIRPFATAGVMFDDFVPPGNSATSGGGSNKFGANFGGGVKVHVKGIWAARFDIREYVSGKPSFGLPLTSGSLWQTEISAGVGIGF